MKNFKDLVAESLDHIGEIFPWDLAEKMDGDTPPLLLDVREPDEFNAMHIEGSLNVPRGILESAIDWGYDDTIPKLAQARDQEVVVICRSGNRSALAAWVMQMMGYENVVSLKTGVRGWNDFDSPLVDSKGQAVDGDDAEEFLASKVSEEQMGPQSA